MRNIRPCRYCSGKPKLIRCGDWKEYWVVICSECYKTPVPYNCARITRCGAVKEWNRRTVECLI